MRDYLAHSARDGCPEQSYREHVRQVTAAALRNAKRAARYLTKEAKPFVEDVRAAAILHDLGKLDDSNQEVLHGCTHQSLPIAHEDAGVAELIKLNRLEPATLVAGHHAGLFSQSQELGKQDKPFRRLDVADHVNNYLDCYRARHCGCDAIVNAAAQSTTLHSDGLRRRIALSCLVDADHGDTARHYGHEPTSASQPHPNWAARLEALKCYVAGLPTGQTSAEQDRNQQRQRLFDACLSAPISPSIQSCEAPVGSGKTTAVMAHLLNIAIAKNLRHIIVVQPYTNIIRQSVDVYRKSLILGGERPDDVVAEHHHQADFAALELRHLATLWKPPIVVTTAVQFFETLASHRPSRLRKLHELPGAAVFIDEMHAAMPSYLWPQAFRWLRALADEWGVHVVLGSGSLSRFWELDEYKRLLAANEPTADITVPDLLDQQHDTRQSLVKAELNRITYKRRNSSASALDCDQLITFVTDKPGPRLLIVNTVQTAAVVAKTMRDRGDDVLHLSTALAPIDREPVINRIADRLRHRHDTNWTLVATSCVEAGVDFSFRTGFRERCSISSLIQTSGRVNRGHQVDGAEVWDVLLADDQFKGNPSVDISRQATARFDINEINNSPPSDLATKAMQKEWTCGAETRATDILQAEQGMEYPDVTGRFRLIDADTRLVIVDQYLANAVANRAKVGFATLLKHSVQLWINRITEIGLQPIDDNGEIYRWDLPYDSQFIGVMAGILQLDQFIRNGGCVI